MKKNKQKEYDHKKIESHWQEIWEKRRLNQPDLVNAKKPFYNLMMYPYPSAEGLHVGNMYAFTGADIYGRFKRMQGYDVFEPIGFDSGGIHSENFAIKMGVHPAKMVEQNISNFTKQLHKIGAMYDWSRTVDAMDPDYYKWTQWIFVQLFKAGLAYKKEAPVTWCPSCKTTVSNEQVIQGKCERCQAQVERRKLKQWFFRITDYAERLLENTEKLNWTEKVLIAQRNWIGKSEGLEEYWQVEGMDLRLKTFTTWPHTSWGATFMVIAPEHPVIEKLVKGTKYEKAAKAFCKKVIQDKAKDPLNVEKVKEGFFIGRYVKNHLNGRKMPLFIANFAVYEYGTGIVKCTPTHDQRDFEFAKKYKLDFVPVIYPKSGKPLVAEKMKEAYVAEGLMMNAGQFNEMPTEKARKAIGDYTVKKGNGHWTVNYHLRDWCISRQRYWGPPIPMIFCEGCAKKGKSWFTQHRVGVDLLTPRNLKRTKKNLQQKNTRCSHINTYAVELAGWFPVPEEELPVLLPDTDDYLPGEAGGKAPLARHPEFYKTKCPHCGGPAIRETDVSDTFLDSSWYFLRYPSVENQKPKTKNQKHKLNIKNLETQKPIMPWDEEITRRWLPVDQYTGGAEHSVLHLMYSRFITMALHDMGYLKFEEPFPNFYAHGLLIKDGAKMSKSRGNVVNPDEYIEKYGADALRAYLMFIGPFGQGGDFRDTGMRGMYKFVRRIYRLAMKSCKQQEISSKKSEFDTCNLKLEACIYKIGRDISRFKYNTAIAKLMEFVNVWDKNIQQTGPDLAKRVAIVIAPFMPYLAEEIYSSTNNKQQFSSVHQQLWPTLDKSKLKKDKVLIIVQVNGKLREKLQVASDKSQDKELIVRKVKKSEKVQRYLEGKDIKKAVFVPGKLVNFVT